MEKLPLCYPQTPDICQQEICVSLPYGLAQLWLDGWLKLALVLSWCLLCVG